MVLILLTPFMMVTERTIKSWRARAGLSVAELTVSVATQTNHCNFEMGDGLGRTLARSRWGFLVGAGSKHGQARPAYDQLHMLIV